MKHLKGVEYLEEETYAHGTDIAYSIDRIDQGCSQSLDNLYQPIGDGEGIDIYILDSGKELLMSQLNQSTVIIIITHGRYDYYCIVFVMIIQVYIIHMNNLKEEPNTPEKIQLMIIMKIQTMKD